MNPMPYSNNQVSNFVVVFRISHYIHHVTTFKNQDLFFSLSTHLHKKSIGTIDSLGVSKSVKCCPNQTIFINLVTKLNSHKNLCFVNQNLKKNVIL